jgi:arginine utilization protein RocB
MKKETKEDIAYGVAKAVFGSISIVGAVASELLQLLVTPPLEKRRNDWMIEVGEKLKQLEQKEELDLTKLANNDVL